ncbi:ROK family protein [Arthrobacter sp. ISL-48]|uniref:ROK family protein n=1 Tax=Arthrobacter sp. ISL-48 TaxID=2819110 RepID=UPI001BE4F9AE|nr:ROK family protein [Arthrobacter sp. ISL-48]MBT2533964.1 ROK family protein [Arthrobacter sp. ISL-48]
MDKEHADPLGCQLLGMLMKLVPPGTVRASISLGAAINHTQGTLYASAPLSGSDMLAFPIIQKLRETRPETEWHVVNDVTAALLAYQDSAPDASRDKVLVTTVSTGIASRLYLPDLGGVPLDAAGLQGEIGHLPAVSDSCLELMCDCGELNHVASYSSGPGIEQVARLLMQERPLESGHSMMSQWSDRSEFEEGFADALDGADPFALLILSMATQPLADVFSYALTIDPSIDRLVLVGGVIEAIGSHYRDALLTRMTAKGVYLTSVLSPDWVSSKITTSASDSSTNLVGAALSSENRR